MGFNFDGILRAISIGNPFGLGSALSPKATAGTEGIVNGNNHALADALYATNGLGRNIIELPVMTALHKWLETSEELASELKRLCVRKVVAEAGILDRLHGGVLIIAFVDDGAERLNEPLKPTANKLHRFEIIPRHDVVVGMADYDTDPASPNYGNPLTYTVNRYVGSAMTTVAVHHSRVFRLTGGYVTPRQRYSNQGWGDSAFTPVSKVLLDYTYAMGAIPSLVKDLITVIIKLDGLIDSFDLDGGEAKLQKRIKTINEGRSIVNSIVIDGLDDYNKQASSLTGLGEVIDRCMMDVSAATQIPVSLLFGRAPQGMSATGEGDRDNWHQFVAGYQEYTLTPLIDWMVGLIGQQPDWRGKQDELAWQWPDLAPMDEEKRANIKLKLAQADSIYSNAGAVDPAWLYAQRHEGGQFNFDPVYEPDAYDQWLAENDGGVFSGQTPNEPPEAGSDPTT